MDHDLLFIIKSIREVLPHTLSKICLSVSCKNIQCGNCLLVHFQLKNKGIPFTYIDTIEVVIEQ